MKNLICITCPKGCRLEVDDQDRENIKVSGNQCKRGIRYAIDELTNPTRVITSTVRCDHSKLRRVPVTTKGAIPKPLIFQVMAEINQVIVKPPIRMGDVIINNVCDTKVDVVATRNVLD